MRPAAETLVWWLLCLGIWLASLTFFSSDDFLLALACSLPCALGAVGARALVGSAWRPRLSWLPWYAKVPWAIVLQTGQVLIRALSPRGVSGRFETLQLPVQEAEEVSAARQGVAGLALSASPGTYIVNVQPDTRETLVHTIPGWSPRSASIDLEQPMPDRVPRGEDARRR